MKDLNEISFENPQVLTAEILLSKFGQHYRDKLVPAINEGLDRLDEISWHTLHTFYLCPEAEHSMVALAEKLDCSIPDARYALDGAMQQLQHQVQRRALYEVSLTYLHKLLRLMYAAKAPVQEVQDVDSIEVKEAPMASTKRIGQALKGILDLEVIRTLLGGAFQQTIAQVNFVQLTNGAQNPRPTHKYSEQNKAPGLPAGEDIPLDVRDSDSYAKTWIRISAYGQVYLLYEGDVSYRGIQVGGGESDIPWMFFDFQKAEQPNSSALYWVRLGYLDQQSKVVLESRSSKAVLQEDLLQVSMQFLVH